MLLKWAIAAVLIVGDVPLERRLFLLDPTAVKTEAECRKAIEELTAEIKKHDATMVLKARCVDVEYTPPAKTTPKDKKSEVTS